MLTEATDLLPRLQNELPKPLARALAAVIEAAEAEERTLYLVGGCVRDLALGRELLDVDLTVEGEVQSLATAAATLGGRWVAHDAFGTGTLEADGARVDLAMARAETYIRRAPCPCAASVKKTLLAAISPSTRWPLRPERGRLLDPFGGWADLRRGLVPFSIRTAIDDATASSAQFATPPASVSGWNQALETCYSATSRT
jgi:tRNA nucleotidyltransferase (CCA-adding enzyme)